MVGGLGARREPNRYRSDRLSHPGEQVHQLLVALHGDGRAAKRLDRSLHVRERHERMERADLGPGGHRRGEHLGPEQPARVDHRLPAVHAQAACERGDRVVGDGHDNKLDLIEQRVGLCEGPGPADQLAEPSPALRIPARDGRNRPAGPRERDRKRASYGPAPDDPDDRWLSR